MGQRRQHDGLRMCRRVTPRCTSDMDPFFTLFFSAFYVRCRDETDDFHTSPFPGSLSRTAYRQKHHGYLLQHEQHAYMKANKIEERRNSTQSAVAPMCLCEYVLRESACTSIVVVLPVLMIFSRHFAGSRHTALWFLPPSLG